MGILIFKMQYANIQYRKETKTHLYIQGEVALLMNLKEEGRELHGNRKN
jgi:hypothetical protein